MKQQITISLILGVIGLIILFSPWQSISVLLLPLALVGIIDGLILNKIKNPHKNLISQGICLALFMGLYFLATRFIMGQVITSSNILYAFLIFILLTLVFQILKNQISPTTSRKTAKKKEFWITFFFILAILAVFFTLIILLKFFI